MEVYPPIFLQTAVLGFDTDVWHCFSYMKYPTATRFIFPTHIYSYVNKKIERWI